MAVSEVNSADVLEILAPIWHTKKETARRMRRRIGALLEWAIAMNYRTDNPCDWIAGELGHHPRDVIEAALAHVVGNKVEAAYARSDLFEQRRRIMGDWAAYLAVTHPKRLPVIGPAEHEPAGTGAP